MRMEVRIRYLLRAALRAEDEGDRKVAETLRRMADEARPAEEAFSIPIPDFAGLECCPE